MSTAGKHIELLLPGLQGPSADRPIGDYLEQRPPALDRLLSRAQPGQPAGHGLAATLFMLFGLDPATPVAPLCYAADTGQAPGSYVMRADPVHLRADQSSLRLFEAHSFPVTRQEADALVDAFNAFYAERGWRLVAPLPQRWYLLLERAPAIETTPPGEVAGADIHAALPRGPDAPAWHALLNEVQMLFHAHEVNRRREQQGQALINSIWPWGGGLLPAAGRPSARRVLGDDPLAQALAAMAGVEHAGAGSTADQLLAGIAGGGTLAVLDALQWPARYNDIEPWIDALHMLEEVVMMPLARALATGRLDSLALLPCNGRRYLVTRRGLRAFWRRSRPFEQVIAR